MAHLHLVMILLSSESLL